MASSITQNNTYASGRIRQVTGLITFHTDGTFTATAFGFGFEGRFLELETNPGGTAPTLGYSITLVDTDGVDRLQGVGKGRDSTLTELVPIVFPGTAIHPVVDTNEYTSLMWTITGNSVNGATVGYRLVYTDTI